MPIFPLDEAHCCVYFQQDPLLIYLSAQRRPIWTLGVLGGEISRLRTFPRLSDTTTSSERKAVLPLEAEVFDSGNHCPSETLTSSRTAGGNPFLQGTTGWRSVVVSPSFVIKPCCATPHSKKHPDQWTCAGGDAEGWLTALRILCMNISHYKLPEMDPGVSKKHKVGFYADIGGRMVLLQRCNRTVTSSVSRVGPAECDDHSQSAT